jgi:tRNA G18 (ribose-2'-O)-methylase SpoU
MKFDKKIALIIGNEEKGVSQLLKKNSDFKI